MHTVCYISIFHQWVNDKDQIDCKLQITNTKLIAIKM